MKWWARIGSPVKGYGRWIPTGCAILADAVDHADSIYSGEFVIEWLLM